MLFQYLQGFQRFSYPHKLTKSHVFPSFFESDNNPFYIEYISMKEYYEDLKKRVDNEDDNDDIFDD